MQEPVQRDPRTGPADQDGQEGGDTAAAPVTRSGGKDGGKSKRDAGHRQIESVAEDRDRSLDVEAEIAVERPGNGYDQRPDGR